MSLGFVAADGVWFPHGVVGGVVVVVFQRAGRRVAVLRGQPEALVVDGSLNPQCGASWLAAKCGWRFRQQSRPKGGGGGGKDKARGFADAAGDW